MRRIESQIDTNAPDFKANHAAMSARLKEFHARQHATRFERPQRDIDRLARQNKLGVRERLELLLDNAVVGLGLVLALLFLFLNARTALWVAAGIPASLLAAVGLSRAESVYITNVLPWRPPQNRDPKPDEIAMMKPFLARHIALAKPEVLVIVGNWSAQALLGKRGITRLRGQWTQAEGLPALPMFHPAYLLRSPEFKREAWADLLSLKAKLTHG